MYYTLFQMEYLRTENDIQKINKYIIKNHNYISKLKITMKAMASNKERKKGLFFYFSNFQYSFSDLYICRYAQNITKHLRRGTDF